MALQPMATSGAIFAAAPTDWSTRAGHKNITSLNTQPLETPNPLNQGGGAAKMFSTNCLALLRSFAGGVMERTMGIARASEAWEASVLSWYDVAQFSTRISHRTRFAMVSDVSLVRRYTIELPGPFLIKERAFGLVAAAPVFVATWDEEVFAWPYTFFAGFIFI